MRIPLGVDAYKRTMPGVPEIVLKNRFLERTPTNQEDAVALLSRPGTVFETTIGAGPIRANFTLKGLFGGDLFTVSGNGFNRRSAAGVNTTINGAIAGTTGNPRMAGVSGAGYERVFIADGVTLQYYGGAAYTATLTLTPGVIADDVVQVDGVYYQFSVGAPGAGAGTLVSPWKVFVNGSNANALSNLRKAINATGVAGTDYSTGLVANPRVQSDSNSATTVGVRGRVAGALTPVANVSVTPTGGADGLAWNNGTLTAGPNDLYGVPMPNSETVVDVAVIKSYVVILTGNSQRCYYLTPGTTTVNALNFFEAESEPDRVVALTTVGDQLWLIGESTTEPWYVTGETVPFAPVRGRAFGRGGIAGTHVKLADSLIIVGDDKIVYRVTSGPEPISTPTISEAIRKSLDLERLNP